MRIFVIEFRGPAQPAWTAGSVNYRRRKDALVGIENIKRHTAWPDTEYRVAEYSRKERHTECVCGKEAGAHAI